MPRNPFEPSKQASQTAARATSSCLPQSCGPSHAYMPLRVSRSAGGDDAGEATHGLPRRSLLGGSKTGGTRSASCSTSAREHAGAEPTLPGASNGNTSESRRIRQELERVRKSGRMFQRAVVYPIIITCSLVLVVMTIGAAVLTARCAVESDCSVAVIFPPGGGSVWVIHAITWAVLPSARSFVNAVPYLFGLAGAAIASASAFILTYWALGEVPVLGDHCTSALRRSHAVTCTCTGSWLAVFISWTVVGTAMALSYVAMARGRPPARKKLQESLRIASTSFLLGSIPCVLPLVHALARPREACETRWALVGVAWQGGSLLVNGFLMRDERVRTTVQGWLTSRTEAFTTAAAIAAMLGDVDLVAVQERAKRNFRGVRVSEITRADLESSVKNAALIGRSKPRSFGEVDAFISHSWADDPEHKWRSLQSWRRKFKQAHGREPIVWLDKFCIDPTQLELNLTCLPVWIATCNEFLILAGGTYVTRMWCLVEIFTFIEMGGVSLSVIRTLTQEQHISSVFEADEVAAIDVCAAQCANETDRDRLLAIIEGGQGGADGFNRRLRQTLASRVGTSSPS